MLRVKTRNKGGVGVALWFGLGWVVLLLYVVRSCHREGLGGGGPLKRQLANRYRSLPVSYWLGSNPPSPSQPNNSTCRPLVVPPNSVRCSAQSSKARRSPQPGDHAHTAMRSGGHRRLRSARARPPLAPSSSSSGRPPHKLLTRSLALILALTRATQAGRGG